MKINLLAVGLFLIPMLAFSDQNENFPVPPSGFDVMQNGIPHGTVTASLNYPTRNYGTRQFTIYLPPGYSTSTHYPVLYLLHGVGGNQVSWIGQGSNEGTAQHVLDGLYSRSLARPMIIVMPYGNMTNTTGDTWQNFQDVLIDDLIPYIQANYSTTTNGLNRALAGLSMGGGQTLNFGPRNTSLLNWIGAFSPAPNSADAATNFPNLTDARTNIRLFWISCGGADASYALTNCTNYHNFVMNNNISQHLYQLEPNLGHEKLTWNRSLYNFAQRIFPATTGVFHGTGDGKVNQARVVVRMFRDAGGIMRFSLFAPNGSVSLDILRPDGSRAASMGSRNLVSGSTEFSWNGKVEGRSAPVGIYFGSIRWNGVKANGFRFVIAPE